MREEDRDALRFLWRENHNDYINDYKMNVHLCGENDSPCVVNFVIKNIANDKYDTDHVVAKSIEEDFYMDNFIKSGNSLETLIHTITSVTKTLSQYGIRLHKWISNNEYLLNKIPESEKASTKILGINWDIESNNLSLREINKSFIPTKRGVLSVLCSTYDPLGFIAPCILEPKPIAKECWKINWDWDDPLPCDVLSRFKKWQKELYLIKDIKVPRFYSFNEHKGDTVELHIFTDSLQLAYGTCAYFHIIQGNDIKVSFIVGKLRLAPLNSKVLAIAKLQIQAAVVTSRMKCEIIDESQITVNDIYFWSDSQTVLKYIKDENQRFSAYIMHRVNEIKFNSNIADWYYVPGKMNIADQCTCPLTLSRFVKESNCLNGPIMLRLSLQEHIANSNNLILSDTSFNVKLETGCRINQNNTTPVIEWKRFPSGRKLVRHFAWIKLLVRRRKSKERVPFILDSDLLKDSARYIISLIQSEAFSMEIKQIRNNSPIPNNSKPQQLNPIISENVLKVNGRLKHSNLPTELKHPIILPSDHHITQIIIRDIHENSLHSGHYWIINAKLVIKRVLSQCIPCKIENMKPSNQLMAQLPNERTAVFDPVFSNTGVDYFGQSL